MKTPMNGKRAGVTFLLLGLLTPSLLWCGCKHTEPDYASLMARLDQGVGGGASNHLIQLQSVTLSNKIDRAWLQPPTGLFTLGPGDKVEIEVIGEPLSRSTTIV